MQRKALSDEQQLDSTCDPAWSQTRRPLTKKKATCKIFVLDLSSVAKEAGFTPACNMDDPKFWPFSQPGHVLEGSMTPLLHNDQQHSGNWYLSEAIRNSDYNAVSREDADMIYVNSHCELLWWLGKCLKERECALTEEPVSVLHKSIMNIIKSPEFAVDGGRKFVFYRPAPADIHPLWNFATNATHLVAERELVPFGGKQWKSDRNFVVPYVSANDVVDVIDYAEKTIKVFYRGGCHLSRGPGQAMRYRLAQYFNHSSYENVEFACTCSVCDGHDSHATLMQKLSKSVFCPIPSGDMQSSRRLTEIIISGCIPVFIGPPFHTMPFGNHVDWASISVIFSVTNLNLVRTWWPEEMGDAYNMNMKQAYKITDTDIKDTDLVKVESFDQLARHLFDMPKREICAKQAELSRVRQLFVFKQPQAQSRRRQSQVAVDLMMENICISARNMNNAIAL